MPATGAPLRIEAYVRQHALGEAFPSPLDVTLEPGLVLQPDMPVVPPGELRRRSDVVRRLLLAVEILSPSSARHDRVTKRPRHQRLLWHPAGAPEPFALDLIRFFADAAPEDETAVPTAPLGMTAALDSARDDA